jgi:hypothetical protein
MAVNILDLPDSGNGERNYIVGNRTVTVTTRAWAGGTETTVTHRGERPVSITGPYLNDTEALNAFHNEHFA